MITSWFGALERAKTAPEVLHVVRDYFATWTTQELTLLPEHCRPAKVRDEADVEAMHSVLVEEYRNTRVSGVELDVLQRLTSFIVRAAIRLSELAPPASGGRDANPADPTRSLAPDDR
jgi:hypothetical protein